MKIALYYPWVYLKGGPERTILEMRRRSRHDWTIFTSHYDRVGTFPEFAQLGVVELPRVSVRRRYGTVLRAAARIATTKLDLRGHDALLVCCDGLGSLLNFRNTQVPIACLCFTPLRAVYDDEYRARHLDTHQPLRPLALGLERAWVQLDRWAWNRFEHVFCISATVRDRVLRGALCDESVIELTYPGIDEDSIAPSPIRERFFFLPGRMMWTKNIELGIEAFLSSERAREQGFRLVIAGMVDEKSQAYFAKLRARVAERSDVEFIRDPSDEQMQDLYRRCYATLFTAFNEDWGLTPLEAMAHGKPVIAVGRGGPTETIVHGATGLLVDPEVAAFRAAIDMLIEKPELVETMGRQAAAHVTRFTWRSFTDKIDAYFETLGARR